MKTFLTNLFKKSAKAEQIEQILVKLEGILASLSEMKETAESVQQEAAKSVGIWTRDQKLMAAILFVLTEPGSNGTSSRTASHCGSIRTAVRSKLADAGFGSADLENLF